GTGQRNDHRNHDGEDRSVDEEARKHADTPGCSEKLRPAANSYGHDLAMDAERRQHGEDSRASPEAQGPIESDDIEFPEQETSRQADQKPEEAGDGPLRDDACEQPRLAQSLDDVEKDWREEDAKERHSQHAAEHCDPQ